MFHSLVAGRYAPNAFLLHPESSPERGAPSYVFDHILAVARVARGGVPMQKFLALYTGSASAFDRAQWNEVDEQTRKQREDAGMKAWHEWGVKHAKSIVDQGSPLGRTKRVGKDGITDITNPVAGYVIVQAES